MHQIRLGRPWEGHWHPEPASTPRAVYWRRFHRPTGLEPQQNVCLSIVSPIRLESHWLSASLNGHSLSFSSPEPSQTPLAAANGPVDFDYRTLVKGYLKPFNELQLVIAAEGIARLTGTDADDRASPEVPSFEHLLAARILIDENEC